MNTQKKNNSTSKRLNLFSKDPLWLYLLGISGFTFVLVNSFRGYLLALLVLLASLVIIYLLYFGENYHLHQKVAKQLEKFNDSQQYSILPAIELSDANRQGYSDYIVISPKGIFNIRILDFEGTISGMENDQLWSYTQVLNPYDTINKTIENPVDPHKRTQRIIEDLLEKNYIKYIPIQSIFVINNHDAIFESDTNIPVVKVKDLYSFIEEYQDRSNMFSILHEIQSIILMEVPNYHISLSSEG
ncbi:nuclease-related domain-containing protein [Alkaliphilus hydrothermalis]|uniref:NERD domain-containing protein n=1 Tax=Alkaliphilus hydrothermalis TaxID=1482730 RepID=A0ABS2NQ77_9FIRM|nr:nuclease-related domain-containing protein [Alkaliphilus hydrothermalis]MBM7615071.1 hypothetical protein [Alkaliphilus hydrothermalis]